MRVCHVSPHLPPDQAANALLPAWLGAWSRARGAAVAFVSQEPVQGRPASDPLPGPVRRLPARRRSSRLGRLLRAQTWRRSRAIARALDEVAADADLLHLHSNGLIVEIASMWARRHGKPSVLTLYGTEIWHYRRRWPVDLFTRAYFQARAVTFYSRGLMDRAVALGLTRPGLSVVHPPVDEAFVELDEGARAAVKADLGVSEPLLILNVKRLHELAGQRYLVEAFARIARQRNDTRLVICGTGPLRGELEALAAGSGVGDRVTFTGIVPNEQIARWAAVADVFALPSLLEALPTVAVEALAAGTPVVSADHPGGLELHELFGDDVRVVPRQDVSALAAALSEALEGPRRVRPATRQTVRAHFGPEAVAAAYERVYAAALDRR